MRSRSAVALLAACLSLIGAQMAGRAALAEPAALAAPSCDAGSRPEDSGMDGRVSADDVSSGRLQDEGFHCNTKEVAHFGRERVQGGAGGFKTYRYVDAAGHECAFYDSTLLFPINALSQDDNLSGVYVLWMNGPGGPTKTANLLTPAMQSPHESLSLDTVHGVLAADMGSPATQAGFVDLYDVSQDCRTPSLLSSSPLGNLGHEGNISADGDTFWVTSTGGNVVTALDVSDPRLPKIVWTSLQVDPGGAYDWHGLSLVDEPGFHRAYVAEIGRPGLTILDTSDVYNRVPNPRVTEITHFTWPNVVSIPQNAIPVTFNGVRHVIEFDEYARGLGAGVAGHPVGAVRIIDVSNETSPSIVSDIRLQVHQDENVAVTSQDPGATFQVQGYAAHYCSVPTRVDPKILACSMILSGLRLFDISDPSRPREIGYFNAPIPKTDPTGRPGSAFAMSAPAFDTARHEVWYTDGTAGFYAVQVTSGWPAGA